MKRLQRAAFVLLVMVSMTFLGCKTLTKQFLKLPPPETRDIVVEKDIMVPMRDGIKLATDVYRPDTDLKYPAIVIRLPYDKTPMAIVCKAFAQRGYACIAQDCRATFKSEGTIFFPLFKEADDGKDTTEWIAKQPWFDGNMGAWGGSYFGYTQWALAPDNKYLKAFYPLITTPNMADMMYVGGALQYELAAGWSSAVGHQAGKRRQPSKEYTRLTSYYNLPLEPSVNVDLKRLAFNIDNPEIFTEILGVKVPPNLNPKKIPSDLVKTLNQKIIDAISYPKLILPHEAWTFDDNYKRVSAPAMSLAGWYDLFTKTQLDDFNHLLKEGQGNAKRSKIIVGPWGHGTAKNMLTKGDESVNTTAMVREFTNLKWFDYWLRGKQNGAADGPPIRIYVMGINEWRDENEWPLARTQYTQFFLHSKGNANDTKGDGLLDTNAPAADEKQDKFDYNPSKPVPTAGGSNLLTQVGPKLQNDVEDRKDMLKYTSAKLTSNTEVTGPITVTLYAASSAIDTDFTAKLVDVFPDGKAVNIQDGIIRARFRDSLTDPSFLEPGKVYKFTIDLWATSYVFKQGHQIRVDITSSNFPRFQPNSNMGGKGGPTAYIVAHQTIYHDAEHQSFITLPIIPSK